MVRPVLNGYVHTKEEYRGYASMLFDLLQSGKINISRWKEDGYEFSAEGIRQAQDDICECCSVSGKRASERATDLSQQRAARLLASL